MEFTRGQVWYVRYDDSVGDEMAVGRAVLIVSSNEDIWDMETLIVAYMTTGLRKSKNVVEIRFNGKRQFVHCSQLQTVSKQRLKDYLGEVRQSDMLKIDETLCKAQGLSHYMQETEAPETLVPVAEPVDIRVAESEESEVVELKAELAIQKKLYEKAVERIIELQLAKDTRVVVEEKIVEVVKPREMTEEEILAWIDTFGEKEPPKKCEKLPEKPQKNVKKGRPFASEHSVDMKSTKEEIMMYAKPGKANINTDEWYVISATSGIPVATAQSITAHRKKHGKYKSVDELIGVRRISETIIDKYRDKLEV